MIYLLRHGLDDEKYIGGWSNVDLTTTGIKQVEEIAKYIKDNNLKIDKILSSDIKRAVTTSKIVNKYLNLDIEYCRYLRELNKGDLNGKGKDKYKVKADSIYYKYPNGESMIEFYERFKKVFYEKIINLDNVLLITHRGNINMIYFILQNRLPDMNKEQFDVTHASFHELDTNKMMIKKLR